MRKATFKNRKGILVEEPIDLSNINELIPTDSYSLNFVAFDSGSEVHWWVHFSARMITVGQSRARGGAARQSILLQNFPAITSSLLCRIKACVQLPHHMCA